MLFGVVITTRQLAELAAKIFAVLVPAIGYLISLSASEPVDGSGGESSGSL